MTRQLETAMKCAQTACVSAKSGSRASVLSRAALTGFAAALLAASGCSGNSSPKPEVGAITFTNANGTPFTALKQITAGESTYLDVTVTNDSLQLGADWSSYCGSAPPPGTPLPPGQTQDQTCGTFTPGHTTSGPVPIFLTNAKGYVTLYTAPATIPKNGTVTLYATASSDRSRSSLVTLTVTDLAIVVQLAPAPPATLALGATTQITAIVSNDPQKAGVNWTVTCAATDCGSFNPTTTASGATTTYTAPLQTPPSGGEVQITATSIADLNQGASATIQIEASGNTP